MYCIEILEMKILVEVYNVCSILYGGSGRGLYCMEPLVSLAETPECYNLEFQKNAIFAKSFSHMHKKHSNI